MGYLLNIYHYTGGLEISDYSLQKFILINGKFYFSDFILSKKVFLNYSKFFQFKVFFYTEITKSNNIVYVYVPKQFLEFIKPTTNEISKDTKKGIL